MATQKKIIGIKLTIENEDTGVPTNFHVIQSINLNYKYNSTSVMIDSYFSEKLYNAGKREVGIVSVNLQGVPSDDENIKEWTYLQLVTQNPEGMTNIFAGAELIEREVEIAAAVV